MGLVRTSGRHDAVDLEITWRPQRGVVIAVADDQETPTFYTMSATAAREIAALLLVQADAWDAENRRVSAANGVRV